VTDTRARLEPGLTAIDLAASPAGPRAPTSGRPTSRSPRMDRLPDTLAVGDARSTIRVVAASGLVSRVVVWRRGPLVASISVSGDEALAGMLLGHATRVADVRLAHLQGAGTTRP
jgi:hypothetical protein